MDEQFKELREWMMERDISLRKHIDERFTQLDRRFTQIDERFTQIDERFTQIEDRFVEMHDYIDERSRDIETRLLTEFHKWAVRIEPRSSRCQFAQQVSKSALPSSRSA